MTAEEQTREAILAAIAETLGGSQKMLALRTGLSEKHICQMLKCHVRISFDMAERLLAALDRKLHITVTSAEGQR